MRFAANGIGFTLAVGMAVAGCLECAWAASPAAPQARAVSEGSKTAAAGAVVPGLGSGVGGAVLARLVGGTNVTESITLNGSVSDTSTSYVTTGLNMIDGGSFANAAGLPMVIQNSGNSVLIQNATILNLQMQP